MSASRTWLAVLAAAGVAGCGSGDQQAATVSNTAAIAHPRVAVETSKGEITIELYPDKAPQTVTNFLKHVRSGFYDGLVFHRVKQDFVIQAGLLTPSGAERHATGLWPIPNENPNGLENTRGAVAMARGADPHSATSEFFIDVKDNPQLDYKDSTAVGWGYAVFGRVVAGMDVVDAIAAVPVRRSGKFEALPVDPVVIQRAVVLEDSAAQH